MKLLHIAIPLREANAWVEAHHRHHGPVVSHKFSIAAVFGGQIVGVATVGRPVARMLNDGMTLEVNRLATDGTRNACSFLYSRCWRAAQALGYTRMVTYILDSEPGTSLRGAGWKCVGKAGGGSWSRQSRPRVDTHPLQMKLRFDVEASPQAAEENAECAEALRKVLDGVQPDNESQPRLFTEETNA